MRQTGESGCGRITVRSLALRLPHGFRIDEHAHAWSQLVHAGSGVLTVLGEQGSWVVPPARAVWVPAGLRHAVETTGSARLRTLYLCPDFAVRLPAICAVIHVSGLLRELILRIVEMGMLRSAVESHDRLAQLVLDEIRSTSEAPLRLPIPVDPRARLVAERVQAEPAAQVSLAQLTHGVGASARTIERVFVRETGMTFGRWRQQARLLHALRSLASGASVTTAGLDAGYESVSAFIAMFRKSLGTTPGRYFGLVRKDAAAGVSHSQE